MEKNPCTITIGPGRFSYLHAFEPTAIEEGGQKKYSVSFIIPKKEKALIKQIESAIEKAKEQGKEKHWKGTIPKKLKLPLRDGDEERDEDEAYAGSVFFNAHSSTKPGLVDKNRQPIVDPEELGSGDYGYVNVTFYPFSAGGSVGVAVGFNHLMKTKDGERLSGRVSVDEAFGNLDVEDSDSLL